jgi:tetratricopeptide (TPR) repeat protein
LAAGAWYLWRPSPAPQPPVVDLSGADPEVAAAVNEAREAVQKAPRSSRAWGRLGLILFVHDFSAPALTALAEAERLDPQEARWPYFQGVALQGSDPERAIPKLRRGAELAGGARPADPTAMAATRVRLARLLLAQGRLGDAETLFHQAEELNPRDGRALLGLAQVARARGDTARTLDYLQRAADAAGARKGAHVLRAEVFAQVLGNMAEAQRERRLAATLPDDPVGPDPYSQEAAHLRVGKQATVERAYQMRRAGQVTEARALLQETVQLYPRFDVAWLAYGETLLDLHDDAGAEKALQDAVRLGPGRFEAHFALGIALYQQRERRPDALALAANSFRRAIRLSPTDPRAHFALGSCLGEQGDPAGAALAYGVALQCRPDYPEAHRELGRLLAETARQLAAAGYLQRLVGSPVAIDLAAPLHVLALTHLRHAVQLAPEDRAAKEALDRLRGE